MPAPSYSDRRVLRSGRRRRLMPGGATSTSDAVLALSLNSGEIRWSRQLLAGDMGNGACLAWDKTNCLEPHGPGFDLGASANLVTLADGKRLLWSAPPANPCAGRKECSPAQSAAVTATADYVLSGSVDGHMRAYGTSDGRILWDYDTVRPFATVNRIEAVGGSLDSAGPTIASGMIFVNSCYGLYGGQPGNVLAAFAPRPQ